LAQSAAISGSGGFASVDLSVFKNIPISEELKAQLRMEMFNIFHRLNLAPPSSNLGDGFGQITDTNGGLQRCAGHRSRRALQRTFALKLTF